MITVCKCPKLFPLKIFLSIMYINIQFKLSHIYIFFCGKKES